METKLSAEDAKKALDWVDSKWGIQKKCFVCNKDDWSLSDTYGMLPTGGKGNVRLGSSFPYIVLTCLDCGNSVFFNAVIIGLLPSGKEEVEDNG